MISLWIANIVGYVIAHWKTFAAAGVVLLVVLIIIGFRGCGSPEVNEKEIQRQQQEIEKRESEKLDNTLQKSNEVLANSAEKVESVEANTREATNKDYSNTSADELKRKGKEVYR